MTKYIYSISHWPVKFTSRVFCVLHSVHLLFVWFHVFIYLCYSSIQQSQLHMVLMCFHQGWPWEPSRTRQTTRNHHTPSLSWFVWSTIAQQTADSSRRKGAPFCLPDIFSSKARVCVAVEWQEQRGALWLACVPRWTWERERGQENENWHNRNHDRPIWKCKSKLHTLA